MSAVFARAIWKPARASRSSFFTVAIWAPATWRNAPRTGSLTFLAWRVVSGLSRSTSWVRVIPDNPRTDADYTMAATVRHACDFLIALGLERANIAGHSRGGYLVARLTLDYPDLIKSCIIVDTNTLAPGVAASQWVLANPPVPRLSRESQRWIIQHYSFSPTHITDSWLDRICEVAALPKSIEAVIKMRDERLSAHQFMPFLNRDKGDVFARLRDQGVNRPTLVMWGKNDPTAILAQGQVIFDLVASRQADARMCVLNQAGHFCFREQPAAFNAAITGFVDGL